MSFRMQDISEILQEFDAGTITGTITINPDDYVAFGMKNPRIYADIFKKLASTLTPEQRTMMLILSVAVRSKKRILAAIEKFSGKTWYRDVKSFFSRYTVEYVAEEGTATISVNHIPTAVPYLASMAWKRMQSDSNRTIENFVQNLWAAQINLAPDVREKQKEWEMHFWDNVVTRGGANYNKGFHEELYENKINNKYPLLDRAFGEWPMEGDGYTTKEITNWLNEPLHEPLQVE